MEMFPARRMMAISSLSVLTFITSFVVGQTSLSGITASTCANPGGFSSCITPLQDANTKCSAKAGSDTSMRLACACELGIGETACALANCWNVVYGCEYQTVANLLVGGCLADNIPFFPAPENAPGRCSCNLGYVLNNITAINAQYNVCQQDASASFDYPKTLGCGCCWAAGVYTSKFSICPGIDPTLEGIPGDLQIVQAAVPQFSLCSSSFSQYDCVNDLEFPNVGSSIPYLSTLPASTGTATFSTLPGTVSAPPAGKTISFTASWQFSSTSTLIVAAVSSSQSAGPSTNIAGDVRPNFMLAVACLFSILLDTLYIAH